MTDGAVFDFSEINALSADFAHAAAAAGPLINSAVSGTSFKVKKAWAEKLEGTPEMPHAARSITYDIATFQGFGHSVIKSEIGAERGRLQAPLVTVLEFGAPGNNLAPHGYGAAALQENDADFQHGLEVALEQAERITANSTGIKNIAGSILRGSY